MQWAVRKPGVPREIHCAHKGRIALASLLPMVEGDLRVPGLRHGPHVVEGVCGDKEGRLTLISGGRLPEVHADE